MKETGQKDYEEMVLERDSDRTISEKDLENNHFQPEIQPDYFIQTNKK